MPDATCIYCGEPASKGEGDHVIPSGLGEFEGDVRFRSICRKHNSEIGKYEAQMLRCGPESLFKRLISVHPRRHRKRRRGTQTGAVGAPTPEYQANIGGAWQVVQPAASGPFDMEAVDHLVIQYKNGASKSVRLHPGMNAHSMKRAIGAMDDIDSARFSVSEAATEAYLETMKTIWPSMRVQHLPATEPGNYPNTHGKSKFTVNEAYFQAVAKIALHYYLCHSRRGMVGDEKCFKDIREFILAGGEIAKFFNVRQWHMPLPLGHGLYPAQWCHLLCADESEDEVLVYLHFFMGPGSCGWNYTIKLTSNVGPVVLPTAIWGHRFVYGQTTKPERYAGRVEPVTLWRMRPTFVQF